MPQLITSSMQLTYSCGGMDGDGGEDAGYSLLALRNTPNTNKTLYTSAVVAMGEEGGCELSK